MEFFRATVLGTVLGKKILIVKFLKIYVYPSS